MSLLWFWILDLQTKRLLCSWSARWIFHWLSNVLVLSSLVPFPFKDTWLGIQFLQYLVVSFPTSITAVKIFLFSCSLSPTVSKFMPFLWNYAIWLLFLMCIFSFLTQCISYFKMCLDSNCRRVMITFWLLCSSEAMFCFHYCLYINTFAFSISFFIVFADWFCSIT